MIEELDVKQFTGWIWRTAMRSNTEVDYNWAVTRLAAMVEFLRGLYHPVSKELMDKVKLQYEQMLQCCTDLEYRAKLRKEWGYE